MKSFILTLLLVCHVGSTFGRKPHVKFTPLTPKKAIPRDLENEAISEEESKHWLGTLHHKEHDMGVTMHLQCDGCWELINRLKQQLEAVGSSDLKANTRVVYDTFCTKQTAVLRLVLDDDNVAMPKYGVGKKTAVFGGWPHKYLTKLCTAIFKQHPIEDIIYAAQVTKKIPVPYSEVNALDICAQKYRCPRYSYERRLNISQMMKTTNYTIHGSSATDYHLRNMPDEEPPKMQSEVMNSLRTRYEGIKKNPSDQEVLQFHREVEEEERKKTELEKQSKAASKRVDRERAMHERLQRRKKAAEDKLHKKESDEPPLITLKQDQEQQ